MFVRLALRIFLDPLDRLIRLGRRRRPSSAAKRQNPAALLLATTLGAGLVRSAPPEPATASSDHAPAAETEHRNLVKWIDRAVARGALHRNTGALKKSQAARLFSRS